MGKSEISWKGKNEEGIRREVYVKKSGNRWTFHVREKRFDQWEIMENPPLEDWQELLDGVRRRINRRLLPPEDEARVVKMISEQFPDAKL